MIAHAALSSGDFPWRYSLPAMLVLCVFPVGSFVVAPQLGEDVTAVLAASAARFAAGRADASREPTVGEHADHVQVLDDDYRKPLSQCGGELV